MIAMAIRPALSFLKGVAPGAAKAAGTTLGSMGAGAAANGPGLVRVLDAVFKLAIIGAAVSAVSNVTKKAPQFQA